MPKGPEAEFQAQIVELAEICGWKCNHVFRLQTKHGAYRTSTTWKGWPDLTLVRPPQIVFLEVKGPTGVVTPEQAEALDLLGAIPGAVAMAVWPKDWDTIERIITSRPSPTRS